MKDNYTARLKAVVDDALAAIDGYEGPKAVTLPNGSKAINNDDSWVIIGTGNPICRWKRDREGVHDYLIGEKWEPADICSFADKLIGI